MRAVSIRWRLTAWYAVVLAAALGLFGGLIWILLRQRLMADLDQELRASAARLQNYFIAEAAETSPAGKALQLKDELSEFCQALPASDAVEIRSAKGFEFRYPESPARAPRTRTIDREFVVGGVAYTLRISESLHPIDHTLQLLGWLLVSLIPAVTAIACVGGAWLSRRALSPVDQITSAARKIGIDNLSTRLPVPTTGDELQRLTEVWNSMLERLEIAVNTLSQFAADASHELRTPLAVIRTSAELALRRARTPESYRASILEIAEEAERMTRLVEDLLFLARNDAGAAQSPMETLDLTPLLREIRTELLNVAAGRGVTIRYPASSSSIAPVWGNRPALRRLFFVLMDNAIKYSHEGGEVRVDVSFEAGRVVVMVRDSGVGIEPSDLPHIFERFYQADKARADSGFGLGLSLAESIARAHNAAIDVSSRLGEGAVFSVSFKATRDRPAAIGPARVETRA